MSAAHKFACPNCGGNVEIHAPGHSITAICSYCKSLIDVNDPNVLRVLQYIEKTALHTPLIPLGRKGVLQGITWQCIGFVVRALDAHYFTWHEYLLFNPYHGFRFLSVSDGHWMLYERVHISIKKDLTRTVIEGEEYRLFDDYESVVQYVLGEFYWRVSVGEKVGVREFIAPPFSLSEEKNAQEVGMSKGEYLSSEVVQAAFADEKNPLPTFPLPDGVAPAQPSPYGELKKYVMRMGGVALAALLLLHIMFSSREKTLLEDGITLPERDSVSFSSQPFKVESLAKTIEISLLNPAMSSNEWDGEAALVNVATREAYPFEMWIAAASGVDEGESWHEVEASEGVLLENIPAGTYEIQYDWKYKPLQGGSHAAVAVCKVTANPSSTANLLAAAAIIALLLLIAYLMNRSFEVARWRSSEYSPYKSTASESDDDDD